MGDFSEFPKISPEHHLQQQQKLQLAKFRGNSEKSPIILRERFQKWGIQKLQESALLDNII